MRISKIAIEGFRAFGDRFDLDLEGGRNLLLHGENGSGKTSVYIALRRFFDPKGCDISRYRNQFVPATVQPAVRVTFVHAGAEFEVPWSAAAHPGPTPTDPVTSPITETQRQMVVDGSRRSGFLDYRALLRAHLFASPLPRSKGSPTSYDYFDGGDQGRLSEQFFDLIAWHVLGGVRTTVAGGFETTIGDLVKRVWDNPPRSRRAAHMDAANRVANGFNDAFNGILPDLQARVTQYLEYFDNHHLELRLAPVALRWDKATLSLHGAGILPRITFRGAVISSHHQFLNEARLSALAACIFLAGVTVSNSDPANPAHPRFLFLDDALIGLELENRLPILDILRSDSFNTYQICLLTHDRVWYDFARDSLPTATWLHRELLAEDVGGRLVPHLRPSETDLERARASLAANDLNAAALHARRAFEARIRNVCESKGIKVNYKKDHKHISAEHLWQGIVDRQTARAGATPRRPDFLPPDLQTEIEIVRSTVLNQLSHAGAPALRPVEVARAIRAVERLLQFGFAT